MLIGVGGALVAALVAIWVAYTAHSNLWWAKAKFFAKSVALVQSVEKDKAMKPVVADPTMEPWPEPNNTALQQQHDGRIFWAYWDSGWDGLPPLWKHCVSSWQIRNPDWELILIHDDNYKDYVAFEDVPPTFQSLLTQHRSDVVRISVLLRYGGFYLDASTVMYKSMDALWDSLPSNSLAMTPYYTFRPGVNQYNNGVLMARQPGNAVLKAWQSRVLQYLSNPALTLAELYNHPMTEGLRELIDDPGMGVLKDAAAYAGNLWQMTKLLKDDESLREHVVLLNNMEWGLTTFSLVHALDQIQQTHGYHCASDGTMHWEMPRMVRCMLRVMDICLTDDPNLASQLIQHFTVMKFSSPELRVLDEYNQTTTFTRVLMAATNTTLLPTVPATL